MTEEKIKELVLAEQGITYSTDHNDFNRADYVVGESTTADGYSLYGIKDTKGNYLQTENGGEDALFMYESGVVEELGDIIENHSSILIYFEDGDSDNYFDNMDWETLANNLGIDIPEEEEE